MSVDFSGTSDNASCNVIPVTGYLLEFLSVLRRQVTPAYKILFLVFYRPRTRDALLHYFAVCSRHRKGSTSVVHPYPDTCIDIGTCGTSSLYPICERDLLPKTLFAQVGVWTYVGVFYILRLKMHFTGF
jgi:hypothetical protein